MLPPISEPSPITAPPDPILHPSPPVTIIGKLYSKFSFRIKFYGDARAELKNMISDHISKFIPPQNENFEYGYPHSNALLQFHLKLGSCKPHKAVHHPTKCDVINDVNYQTIFDSRKFLTSSN